MTVTLKYGWRQMPASICATTLHTPIETSAHITLDVQELTLGGTMLAKFEGQLPPGLTSLTVADVFERWAARTLE